MFDDIPDPYKNSTASDPEEGWRYTQRDKEARRPPELLTRDHVARCIVREIREGRGSPHGGVFLDISWIKEKLKDSEAHIRRKLPSMYHQFKELAGIDITKEAMEVGPTTHYVMGGVKVDGETQMSRVPGLFAAGECAGGLHGANRLGGNSLSDLLVFGKRAGEHAAAFASANPRSGASGSEAEQVEAATRDALAPLERQDGGGGGVGSYAIQSELQDLMQAKVGIVRNQAELGVRARRRAGAQESGPKTSASPATAPITPAGTPPSICRTCSSSPRRWRAPPHSGRRAAGRTSARITPARTITGGTPRSWSGRARTAGWKSWKSRSRRRGKSCSRSSRRTADGQQDLPRLAR